MKTRLQPYPLLASVDASGKSETNSTIPEFNTVVVFHIKSHDGQQCTRLNVNALYQHMYLPTQPVDYLHASGVFSMI